MKTEKTRLQELAAGIEDDMKTTLGSLYKGISIETKGLPLHSQESISIHESGSYSAADIELRKDYVTEVLKAMGIAKSKYIMEHSESRDGLTIDIKFKQPLKSREGLGVDDWGDDDWESEPYYDGENPYDPAQYISFDAFKANLKKTLGL